MTFLVTGDFLKTLEDPDLNVRRVALVTFNSAAHNKPSLIRDLLDTVLPHLYNETKVRKELIREVCKSLKFMASKWWCSENNTVLFNRVCIDIFMSVQTLARNDSEITRMDMMFGVRETLFSRRACSLSISPFLLLTPLCQIPHHGQRCLGPQQFLFWRVWDFSWERASVSLGCNPQNWKNKYTANILSS